LRRQFRGYKGEKYIGDASPYYSSAPYVGVKTPELMYKVNPEMKIVYSMRNPFSRMISSYKHDINIHKKIGKPILEDFNTRLLNQNHLLKSSLYYEQLEPYLKFFPKEQIHIMLFEELLEYPDDILVKLMRFLGCDDTFSFDTSENFYPGTSEDYHYSEVNYLRLIGVLREDILSMEKLLGRSLLGWNLTEKTWCKNK